MNKLSQLFLLASTVVVVGCATIIGEETQLVPIASTPSGAIVLVTDESGREVFEGKTPTSVTLDKSDGGYWGGKDYTVTITKPGYASQTIPISSSPNGWYIGGNFIFGGLIGWFIVDPLNGGMYTLSPEQVDSSLGEGTAHNNTGANGGISIVLLEDVPQDMRDKMVRVN